MDEKLCWCHARGMFWFALSPLEGAVKHPQDKSMQQLPAMLSRQLPLRGKPWQLLWCSRMGVRGQEAEHAIIVSDAA